MNDCRFGVSPENYPDPDPDILASSLVPIKISPNFRKLRTDGPAR